MQNFGDLTFMFFEPVVSFSFVAKLKKINRLLQKS